LAVSWYGARGTLDNVTAELVTTHVELSMIEAEQGSMEAKLEETQADLVMVADSLSEKEAELATARAELLELQAGHSRLQSEYVGLENELRGEWAESIRGITLNSLDWFRTEYRAPEYRDIDDPVYKITAIYYYLADRIQYLEDPHGMEHFQAPLETHRLEKGDCDDIAILMSAMYEAVGLDAAISSADTDGDQEADHARCIVYYKGTSEEFLQRQSDIFQEMGLRLEGGGGIIYFAAPVSMLREEGGRWGDRSGKYNEGIWLTLEELKGTSLYRFDADFAVFKDKQRLDLFFEEMLDSLRGA
jgi:hypothetical protein